MGGDKTSLAIKRPVVNYPRPPPHKPHTKVFPPDRPFLPGAAARRLFIFSLFFFFHPLVLPSDLSVILSAPFPPPGRTHPLSAVSVALRSTGPAPRFTRSGKVYHANRCTTRPRVIILGHRRAADCVSGDRRRLGYYHHHHHHRWLGPERFRPKRKTRFGNPVGLVRAWYATAARPEDENHEKTLGR